MGGGGVGVHPTRLVSNVAKPPSLDGHNAWDGRRNADEAVACSRMLSPGWGRMSVLSQEGTIDRFVPTYFRCPAHTASETGLRGECTVWNAASVRSGSLDFMGSETCCRFGKCFLYPRGDTILSFRPLFFFFSFSSWFLSLRIPKIVGWIWKDRSLKDELRTISTLFKLEGRYRKIMGARDGFSFALLYFFFSFGFHYEFGKIGV